MKELSLREVQLGELEILKRLDSICREQGLKYFLYAGTMIGAVRHKAFIPWDDDIDVAMPRRDYDRLMAWWDEHGAQEAPLQMMNIHTNPKYISPISRLCDTRYQVDYEGTREYGLGLFVDIYPFDGCGSTQEEAEQILQSAADRGEAPLLVVCDEISDPHNLGAILRTAECAGAHGVIIPKRRSAGLTAIVAKTSAGAVSYIPVARVPNIPALLKDLKKQGVWVFGTAADGNTTLYNADLKGPAAIVIGSEGTGMTRLAAENCDFLVSIPMKGKISSLNASAAAAILLYEAVRQRG